MGSKGHSFLPLQTLGRLIGWIAHGTKKHGWHFLIPSTTSAWPKVQRFVNTVAILAQEVGSSVGSISIVSTDSGDMPLSQLQIDALKTPATVIEIQTDNPKKPGSKAAERFDRYKMATTIQEATNQGANWQDLSADFEKGYLKIRDIKPVDVEMDAQGSTKRGAPEGTPDREADARSKLPSTAVVPRALAVEPVESGAKVEMSAATISALRSMMRDEIRYGMVEMEQRFSAKLSTAMGEIREELGEEKVARQQLEERLSHLEQQNMGEQGKHAPQNFEDEDVDKSVVVVGGFVEKSLADAEALVQEMMVGIKGYKDVDMIDVEPPLALARFDSPGEAMKFIRSQKKNATVQTNQLWASENRSKTERSRCKIVSKIKKYLIELGGIAPANVIASYKNFRVVVRHNSKLIPVAQVGVTLAVGWLEDSIVNVQVREAMEAFLQDLE